MNLGTVDIYIKLVDQVTDEMGRVSARFKQNLGQMGSITKQAAREYEDVEKRRLALYKQMRSDELNASKAAARQLADSDKERARLGTQMAKDRAAAARAAQQQEITDAKDAARQLVASDREMARVGAQMAKDRAAAERIVQQQAVIEAKSAAQKLAANDRERARLAAQLSKERAEAVKAAAASELAANKAAARDLQRAESQRAAIAKQSARDRAAAEKAAAAQEIASAKNAARELQRIEKERAALAKQAARERVAADKAASAAEIASAKNAAREMQRLDKEREAAAKQMARDLAAAAKQAAAEQARLAKQSADAFNKFSFGVGSSDGSGMEKMLERLAIRVIALSAAYKTLAVVRESVGDALEVNEKLATIEAITNAGAKGVDELRNSFGRLATEAGRGPKELADAYYLIASNTQDASVNMNILNTAAKASAVGLGNTADIARLLTGVINAYGKENITAAQAADQLFVAVRDGGAEAAEMASVLGRVTALAAEMGVSFKDALTFIATFTRLGVHADEAVTALRASLNNILKDGAGSQAAKQLKLLGSSVDEVRASIREKGFTAAMLDLIKLTKGDEEALKNIFGNVRGLAGILAVYARQGQAVVQIDKDMQQSQGELAKGFDIVSHNASFAAKQMAAEWENFKTDLGNAVLPAVIELGREFMKSFSGDTAADAGRAISGIVDAGKSLIPILELLVRNADVLVGVFKAWLALKAISFVSGLAVEVNLLAKAFAVGGEKAAFMSTQIGLIGTAGAALIPLLLAINEKVLAYIANLQRDIEADVAGMREAGNIMQDILGKKPISIPEANEVIGNYNQRVRTYNELIKTVSTLEEKERGLAHAVEESSGAGRELLQDRLDGVREELAQARQREAIAFNEANLFKKRINQYNEQRKAAEAAAAAAAKANKATGTGTDGQPHGRVPHPDDDAQKKVTAEQKFANAVEETMDRLDAQTAEIHASYVESEALLNAVLGVGDASAKSLNALAAETREREIQRRVVEETNRLKKAGQPVDDAIVKALEAKIRKQVEEAYHHDVNLKKAQQIEKAQAKQLVLAEKINAEERERTAEMEKYIDAVHRDLYDMVEAVGAAGAALEAFAAGGPDAMRFQQIYTKLVAEAEKHGKVTAEVREELQRVAATTVEVEKAQERVNALLQIAYEVSEPTWSRYLKAGLAAADAIGDGIRTALVDALTKGKVDGEAIWKSFVGNIVSIFADMLTKMLVDQMKKIIVNWLITENTKTAITAQQAATRAAIDSKSSGSTGGTGGTGSVQGYAGMYQQAQSAGVGGGAGSGFGGAMAFAAIAAVVINWLNTKGTPRSTTNVSFGGSQGIGIGFGGGTGLDGTSAENLQKNSSQVMKAALQMIRMVNEFIVSLGGQIDRTQKVLGQMSITKKGQGKKTDWIVTTVTGMVEHFGKDMEAAMQFAMVQAIKATPTTGLSPEVAAAIKNSIARDMDALNADIAAAMEVLKIRLGDIGFSITEIVRKYDTLITKARELGIATDGIIDARNREIQALRNSLLGIDTSTADYLASLGSFNAGIAETSEAMRRQLEQQIAQTEATINRLLNGGTPPEGGGFDRGVDQPWRGGGGGGPATGGGGGITDDITSAYFKSIEDLPPEIQAKIAELKKQLEAYIDQLDAIPKELSEAELSMGVFNALYKYLEGSKKYEADRVKWARLKVELEFAAIKAQLIALGKWEEFEGMFNDAYNAARDAVGKPAHHGGGGGGGQITKKERDEFIRDAQYAINVARGLISPLQQSIDEINKRYKAEEDGIKKNSEQYRRLEELRKEEIALAIEAAQLSATQAYDELVGNNNAFTKVRKQFADVRKQILDAGFSADVAADMIARLAAAEEAAIGALGTQMTHDLLGNIISMLDDGVMKTELMKQQAYLNWVIQLTNLKAQYTALVAQGVLVGALQQQVKDAIDYIEQHPPGTGTGDGAGQGPFSVDQHGNVYDGAGNIIKEGEGSGVEDLYKQAMDLWKKYQMEGMSEWERALKELNDDFAIIRSVMGNTPAVAQLYGEALQRLKDRFLDGLRAFRQELATGELGAALLPQQFAAAQQRYAQLRAALAGADQVLGTDDDDLSQADAFEQIGRELRDLAAEMFGTATGGFATVVNQILADLDRVLGASAPNNLLGGPEWFAQGTETTVASIESVASAVNSQTTVLGSKLDLVNSNLVNLSDRVSALEADTTPSTLGFTRTGNG